MKQTRSAEVCVGELGTIERESKMEIQWLELGASLDPSGEGIASDQRTTGNMAKWV